MSKPDGATELEGPTFSAAQAVRLIGITYRQLDYWARTGLVIPSESQSTIDGTRRLYSFDDLVQLRVVKNLLDAGMSLKKIRSAIEILREEFDSDRHLGDVTLLSDGQTIYAAHSEDEVYSVFERGQGVFGIAVGPVVDEVLGAVSSIPPDEAETPRIDEGTGEDSAFADEIADHVRSRIVELETHWQAAGESLTSWGDPEDWARRLVAPIPDRSSWDDRIGPFYRSSTVADRLGGISRQALSERRQRGSVLAMKTSDGVWVHPTWQFHDDGTVVPGLADVVAPFATRHVDGWEIAGWLESTFKELGGASPRQCLLAGADTQLLSSMAREAALRLAS